MYDKISATDEVIRSSWPTAFTGMYVMGLSLPDLVAIATLLYIVTQLSILLWRFKHEREDRRAKKREKDIDTMK